MSKRIDLHRSVDLGRRNCIKERRGGEKKKRAGCVIRVCTFPEILALMVQLPLGSGIQSRLLWRGVKPSNHSYWIAFKVFYGSC